MNHSSNDETWFEPEENNLGTRILLVLALLASIVVSLSVLGWFFHLVKGLVS